MNRSKRLKLPRPALAAMAIAAVLLLLFVAFRDDPVAVDAVPITRGPLRVTVDEDGETRVRERFVMAAPTTGRLLRITVDEGDPVEAGAILAHIQPVPLDAREHARAQARLEAAEANERSADARVAQSQATLEQARRKVTRANQLLKAGTLSTEEHEQVLLNRTSRDQEHEAARFAAQAAEREAAAARAVLLAAGTPQSVPGASDGGCAGSACFHVLSPISGRVLRVLEESERIVTAGLPLLVVGDPSRLEIVVDVLSTDAVRIRPGAALFVEDWGGEQALEARVRQVEPSGFTKTSALGVEEQRVNVIADLLEPAPGLGDGYRVEARIVVWEADNVLRVPASALFRQGERWSVFVLDAGRARLRAVDVGERGTLQVQVLEGLSEGELVVVHPSDRVADGVRIEASPVDPGS